MKKFLTIFALLGTLLAPSAAQADDDDALLGAALAAALGIGVGSNDPVDYRWHEPYPYYRYNGVPRSYYYQPAPRYYRHHQPRGRAHGYWKKNGRGHPYAYSRRHFDYRPDYYRYPSRRDGRWEWDRDDRRWEWDED